MAKHASRRVKELGINKQVSWHTLRRTYATVQRNQSRDVAVEQELLRHGATKVTLDIYAQAQMLAKREAQRKVVVMMRTEAVQAIALGA